MQTYSRWLKGNSKSGVKSKEQQKRHVCCASALHASIHTALCLCVFAYVSDAPNNWTSDTSNKSSLSINLQSELLEVITATM
jgi:hypothetical protein